MKSVRYHPEIIKLKFKVFDIFTIADFTNVRHSQY